MDSSYTRGDTGFYVWHCTDDIDTGMFQYSETVTIVGNIVNHSLGQGALFFPPCVYARCLFPPGPRFDQCDTACLAAGDSSLCCTALYTCDSSCLATGYCEWSCGADGSCLSQCSVESDTAGCCAPIFTSQSNIYSLVRDIELPWPYGGNPSRTVDSCYQVYLFPGLPFMPYSKGQVYQRGVGLVSSWYSASRPYWYRSTTLVYASNACPETGVRGASARHSHLPRRTYTNGHAYDLSGRRIPASPGRLRTGVFVLRRSAQHSNRLVLFLGP